MIPGTLESYYDLHAPIYDLTRPFFLFGRNSLIHSFPELPDGANILDLGCGTGKILQALDASFPDAEITGIDPSTSMLKVASKKISERIRIVNESYSINSFEENSLDMITASYSLTMMEDLDQVLDTIRYQLKPGGYLLVCDFDKSTHEWFIQWMKKNHVKFDHQLFKRLKKEFEIKHFDYFNVYFGLYSYGILSGINKK